MESVNDVKEALSARSRTATLDQLASQGRKRLRLIKADQVAAMIQEAVHKAVESSGLASQSEAEELVERSRQELRRIIQDREKETRRIQQAEEALETEQAKVRDLQQQLEATQAQIEELQGGGQGSAVGAVGAGGAGMSPQVMAMLMNEIATLKAAQAGGQPAAAGGAPDLSAMLEKMAGSLNDRLEQFGRKMGISSAVDAADMDFTGMFRDDAKELESNMDNIQVKQKAGGGIAANLAKLKKLKGGG